MPKLYRISIAGSLLFGYTKVAEIYGELDISDHTQGVTIGALELTGGVIAIQLGNTVTNLTVSGDLILNSTQATFSFWTNDDGGFAFNTPYTILTNANLSGFTAERFSGNSIEGVEPRFAIVGDELKVTFLQG